MPAANVQSNFTFSAASASSIAVALTGVASGNLIVVGITWNNSDATISVSDGTNTYTQVGTTQSAVTFSNQAVFRAFNVTGGSLTITATLAAGSINNVIVAHEASGILGTDPNDGTAEQIQTSPGSGTDGVTSTSFTTTAAGDYVWGFTAESGLSTLTVTQGTNFTAGQSQVGDATHIGFMSEFLIQGAAGSIAATFTYSVDQRSLTTGAAFKAGTVVVADTAFVGPVFRSRMREW